MAQVILLTDSSGNSKTKVKYKHNGPIHDEGYAHIIVLYIVLDIRIGVRIGRLEVWINRL